MLSQVEGDVEGCAWGCILPLPPGLPASFDTPVTLCVPRAGWAPAGGGSTPGAAVGATAVRGLWCLPSDYLSTSREANSYLYTLGAHARGLALQLSAGGAAAPGAARRRRFLFFSGSAPTGSGWGGGWGGMMGGRGVVRVGIQQACGAGVFIVRVQNMLTWRRETPLDLSLRSPFSPLGVGAGPACELRALSCGYAYLPPKLQPRALVPLARRRRWVPLHGCASAS